jgi:2-keto-3-deoxy-L-rhamnonate aldolase RhmA
MSLLKQKLKRKEIVCGGWISLTDPAVVEILARSGFDFLIIDAEHSPITIETMRNLVIAAKDSPTGLLVRVPWNDPILIKPILDLGVDGILVPMVNSGDEARRAVAACKYPPQGIRSVGAWRASDYYRDDDAYILSANDEIVVMIQIEHIDGVNAVDDIVQVQGLDAIFVGPSDLAASMNHFNELRHPEVMKAIEHVAARAGAADIVFGIGLGDPKGTAALGARLFMSGQDSGYLAKGARLALEATRSQLNLPQG